MIGSRRAAYRRGWIRQLRLPCPVVSVGNLTVGGAGKTACVEWLARKLRGQGRRVAVLSRGYGGRRQVYALRDEQGVVQVTGISRAAPGRLADEPQLLATHLPGIPIFVGASRADTGQRACAQGADLLILDDGFQHWRLRRDCDIVLVHARMPLGGWALFPRGPMREPLAALARAQVIVMTKADDVQQTMVAAMRERFTSINPEATFVAAVHEPISLVEGLTGAVHDLNRLGRITVGLVSSIGDPAGFESTVRRLEAQVAWHEIYPDHYRYGNAAWDRICARVQASGVAAVVTTEKDWIRLRAVAAKTAPAPVLVLGVRMKMVSGEGALDARLARLCAG